MKRAAPIEVTPEDSAKHRILAATLRLVAAEGLDAVRHRRVADMAEVSLGLTTYHFASRDRLIEEAFGLYLEESAAFLHRLEDRRTSTGSPSVRIVDFIAELLSREFRTPAVIQAEYELILYAGRNHRLAARLARWEADQRANIEQKLRSAGADQPADAARTLWTLVRGLELERLLNPGRQLNLRRRLLPVVEALLAQRAAKGHGKK